MKRARGKAKQAIEEESLSGAEALQLKQTIDVGRQPDLPTLLRLLNSGPKCENAPYNDKCKAKASNVNCLCNLIPAPNRGRKGGLWARYSGAAAELGSDPATLKREKRDQPVGLRNLGNTCYVNSVLQCLFANRAFRRAVYAVRPPVAEHPAVKELRQLFVDLEAGAVSPVDPGPLVGALQLDHGVQQDGQEFMKLLLTMLEAQFGRQAGLKDVIPSLFRGQSGYETVCQTCHRPSESSNRAVNFYELDVPVKGFKSLRESLSSLLAPELLCGPNQYSCDFCSAKVDATRQLRLRALPPMLCLSLQRFVFDFNKMDRVKATDKFAFPLELDMGPYFGDQQQQQNGEAPIYDLVAILIHKGGSAMHGHYVAHIHMDGEGEGEGAAEASAGWWRFDDEGVARMKGGPCSSSDHGAGAAGAKKAGEDGAAKKRGGGRGRGRGGGGRGAGARGGRGRGKAAASSSEVVSLLEDEDEEMLAGEVMLEPEGDEGGEDLARGSDSDYVPDGASRGSRAAGGRSRGAKGKITAGAAAGAAAEAEVEAAGAQGQPSEIVSQNAYLLVYRQRGAQLAAVELDEATQQWLAEARERLQSEYEQRCSTYAAAKEGAAQRTQGRQQEVRALVEAAVQQEEGDPGHFISLPWLQQWADADGSTAIDPIDNSALLCTHGKLDPSKIQEMRRISSPAWEQLRTSYKGGPALQPADACLQCLSDMLAAVAASEDSLGQREQYVALAASLLEDELGGEEGAEYYISRQWLSNWHKRSGRSMGSTSPTAAITCPHGRLLPEQLGKQARRVGIPSSFWSFLKLSWHAALAEQQRKQQQKLKGKQLAAAAATGSEEVMVVDSDGDMAVVDITDATPAAAEAPAPATKDSGEAIVLDGAGVQGGSAVGSSRDGGGGPAGAREGGGGAQEGAAMPEFPWDSEECSVCLAELYAAAEVAQDLRGQRELERATLSHLLTPPPLQLTPGGTYNLVPSVFMEQWRAYMAQAGRKGGAVTPGAVLQPPSLAECMSGVMCECHSGESAMLAHPPPPMVTRRNRWQVDEGDGAAAAEAVPGQQQEPVWELLEPKDWQALVAVYGGGDRWLERGVTAVLREEGSGGPATAAASGGGGLQQGSRGGGGDSSTAAASVAEAGAGVGAVSEGSGLCSSRQEGSKEGTKLDSDYEVEIGEDYMPKRHKSSRAAGKRGWLEVRPPVCEAFVAARREAAKAARLVYEKAEVMVEVVTQEEAFTKPAGAAGGERKSKRARKGRAPIVVDSTHTLGTLRLRIFETVEVHPLNARIYVRGELLERDDSATLAECEIYPGEEIKVVDSKEHDPTDYASIVALYGGDPAGARKGRQREAERGFTGTALHGLHDLTMEQEEMAVAVGGEEA